MFDLDFKLICRVKKRRLSGGKAPRRTVDIILGATTLLQEDPRFKDYMARRTISQFLLLEHILCTDGKVNEEKIWLSSGINCSLHNQGLRERGCIDFSGKSDARKVVRASRNGPWPRGIKAWT